MKKKAVKERPLSERMEEKFHEIIEVARKIEAGHPNGLTLDAAQRLILDRALPALRDAMDMFFSDPDIDKAWPYPAGALFLLVRSELLSDGAILVHDAKSSGVLPTHPISVALLQEGLAHKLQELERTSCRR